MAHTSRCRQIINLNQTVDALVLTYLPFFTEFNTATGSGGDCVWEMDGIYKEHAEFVYKYIFSLSLDTHTAEELTQETFYRAMLSIDTFNGKCKMSTWLCQIAKHLWYQELDKRRRRQTEPLDETYAESSDSLESTVLDNQNKLSIYRMLHNLPDPMKEVMYLRLSGELSFKEIGELLGQTETWSRVTFYRAKKKIMEGLE